MEKTNAVILAAGEGTRMKSSQAKVLCEVLFKPMIDWVVDSVIATEITDINVVTGFGFKEVEDHLKSRYGQGIKLAFPRQEPRIGTGHAVMAAIGELKASKATSTVVLCGDAPFVDNETLRKSFEVHTNSGNAMTIIGAKLADPTGYGRIVADGGSVKAIVEQREANSETLKIDIVNSGAYWFDTQSLLDVLPKIGSSNLKGEYYLTDAAEIFIREKLKVGVYKAENCDIILGANDKLTLLNLNEIARVKIINSLATLGVDFISRDGVVISPDAIIQPEATILPGTIIDGGSSVGAGSIIGPNSVLYSTVIGKNTKINATQCTDSVVGDNSTIGPFSQLRPNSTIGSGVKIGDFVEVKNSVVGDKTSIAHLTYIGDSDVGSSVNFGCGVVTVNYDGVSKARCIIKDNSFIGCNTNLIAPVTVGKGAYTAAGTTVTKDVPDGSLVIGRSKQTIIDGWAAKKMALKNK